MGAHQGQGQDGQGDDVQGVEAAQGLGADIPAHPQEDQRQVPDHRDGCRRSRSRP